MKFETVEVTGNGREKTFVECPSCGQKLLSVASLEGETKVVVKCRRCHRFIEVKLIP